jgi:hypothetical protein
MEAGEALPFDPTVPISRNNASSVRSGARVQNGRDEVYRKATEFVRLEKLDGDSGPDTAGPSVMGS